MLGNGGLGALEQVTKFVRVISYFDYGGDKGNNGRPLVDTCEQRDVTKLNPNLKILVEFA